MKRKVTAIINIVKDMPEFTQWNLVGGMCYSAINAEKFTNKKISEVVSQLRELRMEYNGSEVQSNLIEKKVDFIQTLESQAEALRDPIVSVKEAYHEVTGSDYIRPSKQAYSNKTDTQAAADADSILAKYA